MSPRCDDLDPFFDGELPAASSAAFRDHLASCDRCQRALRGRMLEAAVVASPKRGERVPGGDVVPMRRKVPAWAWATASAAIAASVAVWIVKPSPSTTAPAAAVASVAAMPTLKPQRSVDVRFSDPQVDRYRERLVVRGEPGPDEVIPTGVIAKLEETYPNAAVAARALVGEVKAAIDQAKRLTRTAASLSDQAALALLDPDQVARQQAGPERALSFARKARRLEPDLPQAMWNEAVALERLELPLAAAAAFDALAARKEPGWSTEATTRAKQLRGDYDAQVTAYKRLRKAANVMAEGGPVMALEDAKRAPSVARIGLLTAIAATADRGRLESLAELAKALDEAPLLAKVRGSDLARRAPVAAELAKQVKELDPVALRTLRTRAAAMKLDDLVRAIALLIDDTKVVEAEDLAALVALADAGPWWRLVSVQRRLFVVTYRARRYLEADLVAGDLGAACTDAEWCPQILQMLAASSAEIGRLDRAHDLAREARKLAREAGDRVAEGRVLSVTGQIAASRIVEELEPGAISNAYMGESTLRSTVCDSRLYQLDFSARAALDEHRFTEAEALLADADRYDETECKKGGVRLNAEEVRLRLIAHRPTEARIAVLEKRLKRVASDFASVGLEGKFQLYSDYLLARARLALVSNPHTEKALRDVLAKAETFPDEGYARTIRASGPAALAEHAARAKRPADALAAIASRVRVQLEPGCTLGISHDDRVTVVARDADGAAAAEVVDVDEGERVAPQKKLLPYSIQAVLGRCPSIEVIATGPYLGVANLLGQNVRWTYRSSPRRTTSPIRLDKQVVVTGVTPPAELALPKLRPMSLGDNAVVVSGPGATPKGVMDAIAGANLVVINAHGVTDANEPAAASLVLSPGDKGSYWLTAAMVKETKLTGAPVVILAACDAGRVQVSTEPWSLANSFLVAGARAVIAPTTKIEDDTANMVFESIVKRMSSGASPEQAVAEEREARGARVPWLAGVVVFQ